MAVALAPTPFVVVVAVLAGVFGVTAGLAAFVLADAVGALLDAVFPGAAAAFVLAAALSAAAVGLARAAAVRVAAVGALPDAGLERPGASAFTGLDDATSVSLRGAVFGAAARGGLAAARRRDGAGGAARAAVLRVALALATALPDTGAVRATGRRAATTPRLPVRRAEGLAGVEASAAARLPGARRGAVLAVRNFTTAAANAGPSSMTAQCLASTSTEVALAMASTSCSASAAVPAGSSEPRSTSTGLVTPRTASRRSMSRNAPQQAA